ncbi:hypothetical protein [Sphingobacterium faecale]|uniref:Uncharacterized protein n=1 Tax=Sphingobacterium faecale TaxID=2803775 RepID=A0ABS1R468_9SPHI|nr:hypothetical protein [Sphingobacterium faecale]MBL1409505.1 hypothetical protein [Sphingobacterium faecale]
MNPLQYDIRHLMKAAKTLNDDKPFMGEGFLRRILKGTYFDHVLPWEEADEQEQESFIGEPLGKFEDWLKTVWG